MNNRIKKIPVISLFSGGGFLDMGFESAGFDIVFSNEIDKDFAQFYKEGVSSWSGKNREISYIGDIQKVDFSELKFQNSQVFGIIGGPPCQDFSIRGSKSGLDGLKGTMTYLYYEKIMDLSPSFFLMENVPGLVLLNRTKDAFKSILDLFKEDYFISLKILNSLEFGIPQSRERLFVVGFSKKIFSKRILIESDDWFPWPQPIYNNAERIFNWGEPDWKKNNLDSTKKPNPPKQLIMDDVILNGEHELTKPNANEYFKLRNLDKVKNIEEGDTYRPSFKRLHRNKYSPTACYGNNEVHLHPTQNRRISVREALRIQGIPDHYIISTPGKLSKKFKMIGNGVPLNLARNMAESIKVFLKRNEII
jgi:DNA (cytosine-5)-methyltransferase 1